MPRTQNNEDAGSDSIASPGTSNEVCRLTTKIPPFWPEEPIIWFAQVEDSKERKLKQLLMHEELGDRKPSQFLRHLQGLAGPDISNDLLITIWTSRLPQNIQTVIAGQTAPTLELLADLADRVHEIAPPSLQVACTSTVSAHASTLENLTSEIAELRRQMRQLTTHSYRQLRPKSRGHPQGRSRSKRKTHRAVANGDRRLPQRTWSPVCNRPLHQNAIPRRHRKRALRFPRSAVQQRRTRTTYQLSAANGTTINTYGYVNLELNLSLRRAYPWRFVVADVTKPIIGADFLQFYNLMVDIRNRRLIDNTTTLSTSGSDATSSSTISSVKILLGDTRYDKLLAKFPDITRPSGTLRSPKHNTVHFIKPPRPSCVLSTTSLGARQITDS
ncbi:hypothetical protein EVAR_26816_1 [Eumeta japonica]|uniref:Uncharacterized protein n=1 Tax=Eumeta variegata TaxID=151549 RepID=A0A4C1VDY1_EUMVA|nr:hypothetical protein EVAR_28150_1 [Eumeta japonica]GBP49107.1 hypothetical protein EVAR_26816_1 [Eumeta japonica]